MRPHFAMIVFNESPDILLEPPDPQTRREIDDLNVRGWLLGHALG